MATQRATASMTGLTPVVASWLPQAHSTFGVLQRKCACGTHMIGGGQCADCAKKKSPLQRKLMIGTSNDPLEQEADRIAEQVMAGPIPPHVNPVPPRIQRFTEHATGEMKTAPASVDRVLASSGRPLEPSLQHEMGQRFGYDFSRVRVHTGADAEQSAQDVNALAYTVGHSIVYGSAQLSTNTYEGKRLLAHELTHVLQQSGRNVEQRVKNDSLSKIFMGRRAASQSQAIEVDANRAVNAVTADRSPIVIPAGATVLQRRAAPYIKKITVHLTPPQTADLEWQGAPPADATGSDHFAVSTGKGYGDSDDPPGTCSRQCCSDAMTQCAPPWNQPNRVGSCCTYYGSTFWTGTPEESHNGWNWWTPIQPWYSSRGIALHQHTNVTGQPIGHGCVRIADANARRIYDYSNGRRTNVTIDGRAAPVVCEETRRCETGGAGSFGEVAISTLDEALAMTRTVPGLEGELT